MTAGILLLLGILLVAIVVFMSEKLRADVAAILVMLRLGLTGLVAPRQVFAGLSSSAVMLIIAVSVLAVWREGTTLREGLADVPLRLGDALLWQGRRERLAVLRRDPDFLVLEEDTTGPAVS
ncbi:MAG: hypothetical protein JNK29_12965 [Anaerolineales bacterium]|nr:hypothetical protein [Anaerolineales bacterium]